MSMTDKKDAFIIIRVSSKLKKDLEKQAKQEGIDLSKFVREKLEK